MPEIKTLAERLNPDAEPRNIASLTADTKNIYKTLSIISKRANQISVDLKRELHSKLDEFAITGEAVEEVQENKEQIEISKFYEKLPNAAIIAMNEYLEDKLDVRERVKDSDEESI